MSLIAEKPPNEAQQFTSDLPVVAPDSRTALWAYSAAVVSGLLLLDVFGGLLYAIATTLLAFAAFAVVAGNSRSRGELIHSRIDKGDLLMLGLIYIAVVALYRIAFSVVEGNDLLLFLFFALGMLVGVAGPVVYTVWGRGRSLATLGLSRANLPRVATLAVVFAAVQFSITFWGYSDLPAAKDVITLGTMALVVGIFEAVFFRGFVQGRLQETFGVAPAVFGAALMYGIYHVGYGMGPEEIVFLSGLGLVYALAYATADHLLVMWPLLTPLGSLFAQLEGANSSDVCHGPRSWISLTSSR